MKKLTFFVILLAILAGVAFFTCPTEQQHKDAIRTALLQRAEKRVSQKSGFLGKVVGTLLSTDIVEETVDAIIGVSIDYQNHYVFSTTTYSLKDNEVITIGLFGVVLPAPSLDDIQLN